MDAFKQTRIGLSLAALIIGAWLGCHVAAVWILDAAAQPVAAIVLFALLSWLSVGLFIIAHDAMHGSLSPAAPRYNRLVGSAALFLYMGFSFDRLLPKHHLHHDHVGADGDPDFDTKNPRRFGRWYLTFMRRYLDLYVVKVTGPLFIGYAALLFAVGGTDRMMHILFWGLPSLVASVQLFYFGTYLPHRHDDTPFADGHNSRSNDYGTLASLASCFHFGYHHEHHDRPGVPWWGLPRARLDALEKRKTV